jgi:hypothetical protein
MISVEEINMDIDYPSLEKILTEAYHTSTEQFRQIEQKYNKWDSETKESFIYKELSIPVGQELQKNNFFSSEGTWFVNQDNGSVGFHPSMLAPQLVRIAFEKGSPSQAVEWLKKVISTEFADGFCIMLLWGLEVNERVELTNDISLMPINDLPESKNKDWAVKEENWFSFLPNSTLLGFPKCALVKRIKIQPFLDHSDSKLKNKDNFNPHKELEFA